MAVRALPVWLAAIGAATRNLAARLWHRLRGAALLSIQTLHWGLRQLFERATDRPTLSITAPENLRIQGERWLGAAPLQWIARSSEDARSVTVAGQSGDLRAAPERWLLGTTTAMVQRALQRGSWRQQGRRPPGAVEQLAALFDPLTLSADSGGMLQAAALLRSYELSRGFRLRRAVAFSLQLGGARLEELLPPPLSIPRVARPDQRFRAWLTLARDGGELLPGDDSAAEPGAEKAVCWLFLPALSLQGNALRPGYYLRPLPQATSPKPGFSARGLILRLENPERHRLGFSMLGGASRRRSPPSFFSRELFFFAPDLAEARLRSLQFQRSAPLNRLYQFTPPSPQQASLLNRWLAAAGIPAPLQWESLWFASYLDFLIVSAAEPALAEQESRRPPARPRLPAGE
ncbi:MAG: hypothetical protein K1X75_03160 [Leptospirales bacterium]|nr:hypothetical protein [Leptospirales bacterium]